MNRQVRAQYIRPGMTIKHAGQWVTITSIAMESHGSAVRHGASIYLADATDGEGRPVRIQLHNDEYGYHLHTHRPDGNATWTTPWQLRRASPAFPNIR